MHLVTFQDFEFLASHQLQVIRKPEATENSLFPVSVRKLWENSRKSHTVQPIVIDFIHDNIRFDPTRFTVSKCLKYFLKSKLYFKNYFYGSANSILFSSYYDFFRIIARSPLNKRRQRPFCHCVTRKDERIVLSKTNSFRSKFPAIFCIQICNCTINCRS